MAASTFDALEASRKLKQAGINEEHAEAIADQLRSAAGADLDQLATKADLQQLAGKEGIGHLSEQLAGLAGEFRIMKWVMGFFGVVMLAMAGRLFDVI